MNKCCCPQITVSTPQTPILNVVTGERGIAGKDATINGVNALILNAEDGISLVQVEDVATISGVNLLSKTETASVVYGTDSEGNQTTYPLSALGGVSDVQVDGTSVVTDTIAELGTMALASTNDYRTASEQDTIDSGKQDVISDLSTIRDGASAGATAIQPNDNISLLTNNAGYITLSSISATSPIAYTSGVISVGDGYAIPTTAQVSQITTNKDDIAINTQAIGTETTNRENADIALQRQIDAIVSSSDVYDIVGTYAELQAYDISTVPVNDIIKVLVDETKSGAATYYRCVESGGVKSWSYIGSEGAYYTKGEADNLFVPQTRTVNNKALSDNISLTASDVGALKANDNISLLNNNAGYITLTSISATSPIAYNNGTGVISVASGYQITTTSQVTAIGTALQPNDNISELNNDSGFITSSALSPYALSSSLATVATSGSYNDLLNKPTIPTVNDSTITFTQGGVNKGSFTLNQASGATIALDAGGSTITIDSALSTTSENPVQNKVITIALNAKADSSAIPTKTSDLNNDSGFITGINSSDVTTALGYTPESTANKVTSISSSSTDTQYPSAKCVYDIVGDIETLLAAI